MSPGRVLFLIINFFSSSTIFCNNERKGIRIHFHYDSATILRNSDPAIRQEIPKAGQRTSEYLAQLLKIHPVPYNLLLPRKCIDDAIVGQEIDSDTGHPQYCRISKTNLFEIICNLR